MESAANKKLKENEVLINNAILCMTHCIDEDETISKQLAKTNIIMDLLYLTRDLNRKDAQKNCGILLAKLSKYDEK